jgi:arylsulfatase A-like enzyme
MLPFLTGQTESGPRKEFIYINDDQQVVAVRYDNWKMRLHGAADAGHHGIWAEPFVTLRFPKLFNLRTDPYERADITSNTYYDWVLDHLFVITPMQGYVGGFLQTFKEFPQRQKAASFNLDSVLEKLQENKVD